MAAAPTPLTIRVETPPFVGCGACMAYVQRRGHVIRPAITEQAAREGIAPRAVAHRFFRGLHLRHLEGRPL